MKKFILSTFIIVSFGLYVISQNNGTSPDSFDSPVAIVSNNNSNSTYKKSTSIITQNKQLSLNTPINQKVIVTQKNGLYKDGEYTGSSVDAYYGNVQVKVSILNSKITDVVALDYPHDAKNSVRINSRAIPILQKEAIVAQNAKINAVSGASSTSPAFIKSLTSALNKAKA